MDLVLFGNIENRIISYGIYKIAICNAITCDELLSTRVSKIGPPHNYEKSQTKLCVSANKSIKLSLPTSLNISPLSTTFNTSYSLLSDQTYVTKQCVLKMFL